MGRGRRRKCRGSAGDAELPVDGREMVPYGLLRDSDSQSDVVVCPTIAETVQYVELASRQVGDSVLVRRKRKGELDRQP